MGSGVRRPMGRAVFEGLLSLKTLRLPLSYCRMRWQKYNKFSNPARKMETFFTFIVSKVHFATSKYHFSDITSVLKSSYAIEMLSFDHLVHFR